jgi:transcriptional regulator with GAF, ATPase, and Fis domain
MVREGRFRSDLYFRLRIISLHVPPLRARRQDILPLARHFVALHGGRYGKRDLMLSPETEYALLEYSWPGNVRELRNCVEQAVLLTRGDTIPREHITLCAQIRPADPERVSGSAGGWAAEPARDEPLTAARLQAVIEETHWNIARAARLLGISRDSLRYRIRKLGVKIRQCGGGADLDGE